MVIGALATILGLAVIVANERVSRFILWGQNTAGIPLGEDWLGPTRVVVVVVGICSIVLGSLFLVGAITIQAS